MTEELPIERIKTVIPMLNDQQMAAVEATEGPVLIIAGPGTGKTLTMIARTMYLLISGKAQPEEIVLTTFTEKAAFELRDRLSQLARELNYTGQLHLLKVGTIHGLCNDFIMNYLRYTPLKKGYTVLDELTQFLFVHEIIDEIVPKSEDGKYLGKWTSKWKAVEELIPYFNKITEELIDPSALEKSGRDFLKGLALSYEEYKQRMFEENKIDFSHLQKVFLDLLKNEELRPKIKGSIKYFMVDEYQDTNFIQEKILFTLAMPENNICVVGDEDQSLYRFRGATVRNILEFPGHFENCKQVQLTINYRSHKEIISKYNKFMGSIDWEKFRFPKEIRPDPGVESPDYPAVFSIWGEDEQDEAERVAHLIKFLKENKVISDYSDVAILLKSVRLDHSGHYIEALKKHNIPYFSPRAKAFFENDEVKLMVACYAIIFGFYDMELEEYPYKGYIDDSIRTLGNSITDSLQDFLRRKVKQIENLKEGSLDLSILDYFYRLLAYKPFPDFLNDENKAHSLSIFSRLISVFEDYYSISVVTAKNKDLIKYYLFGSYFNFLIGGGVDEYEDPDNPIPKGYVQIMTFHQSKGLEFPVVIVGSLHKQFSVQKQVDRDLLPFSERGLFETERQMTDFDKMRHYYVAFSRAQKLLALTSPEKPKDWFAPIWEGLDQYPYVEKETLKAQTFKSRPQFVPKKSYSLSHVNAYETCPQQYLFYHEYEFEPSRSAQLLFGNLVHFTIEDIHKSILDGKPPTEDHIEEWFEKNYKALLLSGLRPIAQTQKESALKQVMNYFNQNSELLDRVCETEIDVSVEKDDYIITGKIDLLLGKDGKFEVLDFKTQPKPEENSGSILDKYFKQLCLYAYILKERYNKPVEKMYIYWTAEDKRKDALMQFNYSDENLLETGLYFDSVVKNIRDKNFQVKTSPDTDKVCKECDFRFYCSQNGIIKFKTKDAEEE
jgi:DNA helicase-2/ATP-dependent DNA helicase PcrA